MLYRWKAPLNSGITAYKGLPNQRDIRLVSGHVADIPTDDPNLTEWINLNVANGTLEAV